MGRYDIICLIIVIIIICYEAFLFGKLVGKHEGYKAACCEMGAYCCLDIERKSKWLEKK